MAAMVSRREELEYMASVFRDDNSRIFTRFKSYFAKRELYLRSIHEQTAKNLVYERFATKNHKR